ncbi:LPXTG cell wall anchor domain-containing protein [Pseudarthrobacter sp. NIBRBAC000502772]|uniref:LPXTG cell wall anchor domain-containing protein n=1 Tax=Pseudarthrobacter sp. NIBRBAC000502772 TaxID=2590775 RepID=UPI00113285DB|nr:LPXTG cell wall anchor domain-containing protein [Pseudarthrobacter sp. NIBRBAC000502772]QDG68094.1 LPXTG cell wall anchor domain-containing protein [Pseudarthrobacter sp. NIBRBAC000502772]
MKKSLAALALAGSLALVGAAPAFATYPAPSPVPPQAAVSDNQVGPGEQFVFRGNGPFAGQPLTIRVTPGTPPASSGAAVGNRAVSSRISVFAEAQTLSATADAQGNFSVPITIVAAGTYLVTATSNTTGATVGPVTVVVDPAYASTLSNTGGGAALANTGGGTGLANTGADSGLILWTLVGAGALAAGAASVVVVRRRAKTEAAA